MEKISRLTIKDQVVVELRKAILNGKLKPGQALVQDDIARELNVSRMPVREALKMLEGEGLVTTTSFKGSVVTKFSAQDIREIYQVRMLMEGYAAEQASLNRSDKQIAKFEELLATMNRLHSVKDYKEYQDVDYAFHHLIAESSGNRRLIKLIEINWRSFIPYIAHSIPGRIEKSISEHTRIVEAIRARDAAEASRLCREQIETVYNEIVPYFKEIIKEDGPEYLEEESAT